MAEPQKRTYNTGPNSHASKGAAAAPDAAPRPAVEKVISGEVLQQKKPVGRKAKEALANVDLKGVSRYVWTAVIVPAAKNLIVDAGTTALRRTVLGEAVARSMGIGNNGVKIQYNTPIARQLDPRLQMAQMGRMAPNPQSIWSQFDYVLTSKEDADRVLELISDTASAQGYVTAADVNGWIGLPVNHTDFKMGWTFLGSAAVIPVANGFMINLPPVTGLA